MRGRLYGYSERGPRSVQVTIKRCDDTHAGDFHFVEEILGPRLYIHDCRVMVTDSSLREHCFLVFFTRHVLLPPNFSLQPVIERSLTWRGEMLVLRVSQANENRVVNLRRGDGPLASQAVARSVQLDYQPSGS